jgi:hypothetical protein
MKRQQRVYRLDHLLSLYGKVRDKDILCSATINGGGLDLQRFHVRAHEIVALVGRSHKFSGLGDLENLTCGDWRKMRLTGRALRAFLRLERDYSKDPRNLQPRHGQLFVKNVLRRRSIRARIIPTNKHSSRRKKAL